MASKDVTEGSESYIGGGGGGGGGIIVPAGADGRADEDEVVVVAHVLIVDDEEDVEVLGGLYDGGLPVARTRELVEGRCGVLRPQRQLVAAVFRGELARCGGLSWGGSWPRLLHALRSRHGRVERNWRSWLVQSCKKR